MVNKRVVIVLALTLAACGGGADPTLEAVIDPAGETTGFANFTAGTEKSFGVFVCSNDGAVELTSIEPIVNEGDVEFLGAMVYTSPDMFVGAANGYPTDGLDETRLEPLEGTAVESDCTDPEGDDRVQLIIGAQRTGSGGGALDGFVVTQVSGGELEIPFTILLCGDEMEFCEMLIPEDGSTATTAPSDS